MVKKFIMLSIMALISIIAVAPTAANDEIFVPPAPLERYYPMDEADITEGGQYNRNFYWEHVDGIEWYHVVLAHYGEIVFDQWYEASEHCDQSDMYCVSGDIWLSGAGQYEWWITRWNAEIGEDYQLMYEESTFSLNIPLPNPPSAPELQLANMSDTTPVIYWLNGADALWYEIWVGPANYSSTSHTGWYDRAMDCDGEGCSFEMVDPLTMGSYEVWGRSWNPTGMSNWNLVGEFTVQPVLEM